VDFLKLDVEGAEALVVAGAQELLTVSRPIVTTEFSCDMLTRVSGCDPLTYLDGFVDMGYALSLIDRETGTLIGSTHRPNFWPRGVITTGSRICCSFPASQANEVGSPQIALPMGGCTPLGAPPSCSSSRISPSVKMRERTRSASPRVPPPRNRCPCPARRRP